jgi:aspartate/methionine/tyrosine aminotransferase
MPGFLHSRAMRYRRMPIEIESPEELGYGAIDHNLAESSFRDQRLSDLGIAVDVDGLLLAYGDHLGDPDLREVIAAHAGVAPDEVIVTPGAAPALFLTASSLLEPGSHAVVLRTNYATNLETPRLLGADLDVLDLQPDDGFALDLDRLAELLRPDTQLVSLTYPHNPTGTMIGPDTLDAVVDLVEANGTRLLLDETYGDMTYGERLPSAACLSERAISVSSLSKTYGLPGLRIGWMLCRDAELRQTLLAAKEQVLICGATLDEAIAAQVLESRDRLLPPIRARIAEHLDLVRTWIAAEPRFDWVEPAGGVVGFPWLVEDAGIDVEHFYEVLNGDFATYVGPGHWFEQDRRFFRLGFGWPTTDELTGGLANLSAAADQATR